MRVHQVHAWVAHRREVIGTPLRTLADEIGISKTALDHFHKHRSSPRKIWPRLRDWCVRTRQNQVTDEYQTPPDLLVDSALFMLRELPESKRAAALRSTAEHYRGLYADPSGSLPEWVQTLLDLAANEGGA